MRIIVQTMKNVKHTMDVQKEDTILQVKQALDQNHHLGAPETLRLIHKGKILDNERTVDECHVKEGEALVVMTGRKANANATAPPSPSTTMLSSSSPPVAAAFSASAALAMRSGSSNDFSPSLQLQTQAAVSPAPSPASVPAPSLATPSLAVDSVSSSLATGSVYEEAINNLTGFGFPRDQAVAAMRAASNNPDHAAEYLFSGNIPASAFIQAGNAPEQMNRRNDPATTAGTRAVINTQVNDSTPANVDLSALGDLGQLRVLLGANPQMLPILLTQLSQSHPELLQQLEDNPEAFLGLLQALGVDPTQLPGVQALAQGGGQAADDLGIQVMEVNETERAQIDMLVSLGFPQASAIRAWLICDRNQELAAAYLLEHSGDLAMMGDDVQFGDDQDGEDDDDAFIDE